MNILLIVLLIINQASAVSYNQPKFCPMASWNPNAITFANKTTVGKDPYGIFVDTSNTIYVVNDEKNLVLTWSQGNIDWIERISNDLSEPRSLFVTINGDIYINSDNTKQVKKWSINATNSVTVMNVDHRCYGVFIDVNNTIYCSMKNGHRVVKKSLNTNVNAFSPVAGNGDGGSSSEKLHEPHGVFVTTNFHLYVADSKNNRIQLFRSGELNGRTVPETEASGIITLDYPTGIILDADEYLFIVDSKNHRIVRSGPNGFQCLVGCPGRKGSAANQLDSPATIGFDSYGNMFVADTKNDRVQQFILVNNSCKEMTTVLVPPTSTKNMKASSTLIRSTLIPTTVDTTTFQQTGLTTSKTTFKTTSTFDFPDLISRMPSIMTTDQPASTDTTAIKALKFETTTVTTSKPESLTVEVTRIEKKSTDDAKTGMSTTETTSTEDAKTEMSATETTISKTASPYFVVPTCNGFTSTGISCDELNSPCKMAKPCQNNASCIDNDTTPTGYSCLCLPYFNGTRCQYDHRPCKPNTCWNNGNCTVVLDTKFECKCQDGWHGIHCESMVNYCDNVTCMHNGVCRPLFMNYTCECLGDSYSGRHCEITATKIVIYKIVSKSFAYVVIIALISLAMFIVIMDILKYCFGIDPVHEERERLRRRKQVKKRKPVIQRFVYVNAPSSPAEVSISAIKETTV